MGQLGQVSSGDGAWVDHATFLIRANTMVVDIRSEGQDGVVMNRLTLNTSPYTLQVGQVFSIANGVDIMGCSGPEDGQWVFDRHADDVSIEVREGADENSLELFFTAGFDEVRNDERPHATTGSVLLVYN